MDDEDDEDFYDEDEELEDEEEDEEEDLDFLEEEELPEEKAEVAERKEEVDEEEGKQEKVAASDARVEEGSIERRLDEVDVEVVVEICRLQLSAKELLALAKGNLLDLKVPLERGVDLVVNGKRFGRGELMRMGDLIGVRILELGR